MTNLRLYFATFIALLCITFVPYSAISAEENGENISGEKAMVARLIRMEIKRTLAKSIEKEVTEWNIIDLNMPKTDRFPVEFDNFEVSSKSSNARGSRHTIKILFHNKGKLIKRLNASAKVEKFAEVVVPIETIKRDTYLTAKMFTLEKRSIKMPISKLCTNVANVIGHIAKRKLNNGTAVRKSEISVPPTVKTGDIVMIIAENTNVKITAKGIAKQDGGIGEVIPIINLRSNKRIYGRITGQSSVSVVF